MVYAVGSFFVAQKYVRTRKEYTVKNILVIKHSLAKLLLREGYIIKDLAPKKNIDGSTDYTRSVYVFEWKEGIEDAINRLK